MATINSLYSVGISGLSANKSLAALSSQNIANANTPGYVRQTLMMATRAFGLPGVDAVGPRAVRNPFLARQLVSTFGRLGYHEGQADALNRVQTAVNDLDGNGVGVQFGRFQAVLSAAAAKPNGQAELDAVLAGADQLVTAFQSTRQQLLDGGAATHAEAVGTAETINGMATEVAALNDQIRSLVGAGQSANELIGRRDNLVGEMGRLVEVESVPNDDGSVSVFVGAGRALVDGSGASELAVSDPGPAPGYAIEVTLERANGQSLALGAPAGGRLGGLVDAFQDTMGGAVAELDELAVKFSTQMNEAFGAGDFFVPQNPGDPGALTLEVNPGFRSDPPTPPLVFDNDAADVNAMVDVLDAGLDSVVNDWQSLTRTIAEPTQLAETGLALEAASANQLATLLLSETAVSVDEELVALAQANSAFEAASEVIKIASQLTDTVLSMV